jgi:hypothetical protein
MKRRARLRPRGTLVRPDDPPAAPARDDDRHTDPRSAHTMDGWLVDRARNAIDSPEAARIADGLLVGDGGLSVAAGVAASVARAAVDHGRALRALRTARARRLAIALGLARAARPG